MTNKRTPIIRYTSRDFQSIRRDLLEYGKRYYGDSFKDQAFVGFGANLVDNVAIVGDMLSYYLDYSVNESFLDSAVEFNNIIRNARQIGYKFKGNPSSQGTQSFFIIVPANATADGPDNRYRGILKRGTELSSVNGDGFLLDEDVNFSAEGTEVVVARTNTTSGAPTAFAVKGKGKVISGRIVRELIEIGNYTRFLRLQLGDPNIVEVISVFDAEGNEFFEVSHLAQDVVYRGIINRDTNSNKDAKRLLRPFVVPRRFVVERDFQTTYLQFGFGSERDVEIEPLIDPSTVLLEQFGKDYVSDTTFNPNKLLSTDKLGIVPANTTLEIVYRTNENQNVNVGVNGLIEVNNAIMEFDNVAELDPQQVNNIISTIETTNEEPIIGDVIDPTPQEIKQRAYGSFGAQDRAVSLLDYKNYCYRMPPQFGSVKRVNVVQDDNSFKRNLNIYVVSENNQGKLVQTNNVIKENLRQWLANGKMINDTIDILDAKIVNYGINYVVVGELDVNKFSIKQRCDEALRNKLRILPEIGQPLFISELRKALAEVESVVDVIKVKITKKVGGVYSQVSFDFDAQTSSGERFINVPDNVIMELKYPNADIKGMVK